RRQVDDRVEAGIDAADARKVAMHHFTARNLARMNRTRKGCCVEVGRFGGVHGFSVCASARYMQHRRPSVRSESSAYWPALTARRVARRNPYETPAFSAAPASRQPKSPKYRTLANFLVARLRESEYERAMVARVTL